MKVNGIQNNIGPHWLLLNGRKEYNMRVSKLKFLFLGKLFFKFLKIHHDLKSPNFRTSESSGLLRWAWQCLCSFLYMCLNRSGRCFFNRRCICLISNSSRPNLPTSGVRGATGWHPKPWTGQDGHWWSVYNKCMHCWIVIFVPDTSKCKLWIFLPHRINTQQTLQNTR